MHDRDNALMGTDKKEILPTVEVEQADSVAPEDSKDPTASVAVDKTELIEGMQAMMLKFQGELSASVRRLQP